MKATFLMMLLISILTLISCRKHSSRPSCPDPIAGNLIINGSMTSIKGENVVAPGWSTGGYTSTPDINDAAGPLNSTPGFNWTGDKPAASCDGGTWQNIFYGENINQTISGLAIGTTYYFQYYYCTQGIASDDNWFVFTTPNAPIVNIIGASGYKDPTDAGKLFKWNKYSGKLITTADSITITVSAPEDTYMAYDGFYLSDKPIK